MHRVAEPSIVNLAYLDILCSFCTVLYEIYRPDSKPLALMLPVNISVQDVLSAIVKPAGDHILVKINSTGGGMQIFFN